MKVSGEKRNASAAQPSTLASAQSIRKPSPPHSDVKEFITLTPTTSKCANVTCQKKHFKIIFCSPFHKA